MTSITPEPEAVVAPDPVPPLAAAVPVAEVVEPLGAQEEPPAIGAVPTWEWSTGSPLAASASSSSTWEPTPFASFAAASPEVEHRAALPVPPTLALPGAIAPTDPDPAAPRAPRAAAPTRPAARTASTPPWTITVARVLLLVSGLGAIALVGLEMALFGLTLADVVYPAFAPRWLSSALFLAASIVGLVLVARRAAAARAVVAAAAIVSVLLFGWMPTVFIPAMVGAAILLAIPGSRPWFHADR